MKRHKINFSWINDFSLLIVKYGMPQIVKEGIFVLIVVGIFFTGEETGRIFSLVTFMATTCIDSVIILHKSAKEDISKVLFLQLLYVICMFGGILYLIAGRFYSDIVTSPKIIGVLTIFNLIEPIFEITYQILSNKRQEKDNHYKNQNKTEEDQERGA